MHAEVDAAEADEQGEQDGDGYDEELEAAGGLQAGEQGAGGQV